MQTWALPIRSKVYLCFFFFQAEDGIRDLIVTGVQTCALPICKALRVFGDGFQASKVIGGKRYWRLPVMEGEFLVEETFGMQKGVGGGNFLILAEDADAALAAAEAAVLAMTNFRGVILPFPGGVVRSGSKVGSRRYKNMIATTNDAFDPTLRAVTTSQVPADVNSVLEIVLDGTDAPAIEAAMRGGIRAACRPGIVAITAGDFGRQPRAPPLFLPEMPAWGAPRGRRPRPPPRTPR